MTTSPSMTERASISWLGLSPIAAVLRGTRIRLGGRHEDAGTAADLDAPLDIERDQCLAQRRARHAELLGQVALRRQARSGFEPAPIDQLADLVCDLLIEPARLDRLELEGHGRPDEVIDT